jgi:hypothetical protein
LRTRRTVRQAVPIEEWRARPYDASERDAAEGAPRIALSLSDVALAALPLLVGLIFLYLGWGRGS